MGLIRTEITLTNPSAGNLSPVTVTALVDTGAITMCVPQHIAVQLALQEIESREVTVADGRRCAKKLIKPRIDADETRIKVMALGHEEITEATIGAAFEVHGILGYGFLEKVEFKRFAYSDKSALHPRVSAANKNKAQPGTGGDA